MTVYRLTPDLSEVVQQHTYPKFESEEEQNEAIAESQRELTPIMKRFPARGFTEKWLGVDLREGEHFKLELIFPLDEKNTFYDAVAVPATEERGNEVDKRTWEEILWAKIMRWHEEFDGEDALKKRYEDVNNYVKTLIAGASSQKEEIERDAIEFGEWLASKYRLQFGMGMDGYWWSKGADSFRTSQLYKTFKEQPLNSNK